MKSSTSAPGYPSRRRIRSAPIRQPTRAPGILDRRRCQCRAHQTVGPVPIWIDSRSCADDGRGILDGTPTARLPSTSTGFRLSAFLTPYRCGTPRSSSSSAEKTAAAVAAPYAGTTLVRGTQYRWRIQVSDHSAHGRNGPIRLTFTPSSLGTITLDGTPTGRITTNQPTFQGKWTHQSSTSMKRVQIRLWNGSGDTILQTGADYDIADVASAAAPGTLFSVSFANSGLSTPRGAPSISTTCVDMMARTGQLV